MEQSYRFINIECPSCGVSKNLKVPESIFSKKKFGIIKIQVPQGAVCNDHIFMVLVDIKGKVLGYETFNVSISKAKEEVQNEPTLGPSLKNLVDTYGFNCIAGLIHAKLFGYLSFMISSLDLNKDISNLNKAITDIIPENYRDSYTIEKIEYDSETFPRPGYYYSLVMSKRANDFLINPYKHVIQVPWDISLEYEQMIITHALKKEENRLQFKVLAEYLYRFVKDVELAQSILQNCKNISEKDLIKKMNENLTFSSINKKRMKLIKEFIYRRISPELISKIE